MIDHKTANEWPLLLSLVEAEVKVEVEVEVRDCGPGLAARAHALPS